FPAELLARLSAEQRASLIAHELAHLKRGDHRVRWLEIVALSLYWWCPLAWFARRELQRAEEECCAAWVAATRPQGTHAYPPPPHHPPLDRRPPPCRPRRPTPAARR